MIGPVTLARAKEAICNDLDNWSKQIKEAYLKQDQTLTVNLALKFDHAGQDQVKVEHSITFIESRIKDKDAIIADEKQHKLPGME